MRELQQKLGSIAIEDTGSSYAVSVKEIAHSVSTAGIEDSYARGDHQHRTTAGIGVTLPSQVAGTLYTNNGTSPIYVGVNVVTATGCGEFSYLEIGGAKVCEVGHPMTGATNSNFVGYVAGIVAPQQAVLLTSTTACTALNWFQYFF